MAEKSELLIKDTVILIGYDDQKKCVYSAAMSWSRYYDGEHPWDSNKGIQALGLRRLHGYLFDSQGVLEQEFESIFNLETGIYSEGWARFSDGTYREDKWA